MTNNRRYSRATSKLALKALTIALTLISCKTLNNRYDSKALECGIGFDAKSEYFQVEGPQGEFISGSDMSVSLLNENPNFTPEWTKNGCVKILAGQGVVVRNPKNDWAAVIKTQSQKPNSKVTLEPYSDSNLRIACSETDFASVGPTFKFTEIIASNLSSSLEGGYDVSYLIQSEDSKRSLSEGFTLLNDVGANPFLNRTEGKYIATFKVLNKLSNRESPPKICKFMVDFTPPDVELRVNLTKSFKTLSYKNRSDIVQALPLDGLSFESNDSDLREIHYCVVNLDDEFNANEIDKSHLWQTGLETSSCQNQKVKVVRPGENIDLISKVGFINLVYRGLDNLGNGSVYKNSVVFFHNKDQIELTRQIAGSKVSLALSEKHSFLAAESALEAETQRLEFPTQFEKSELKNITKNGLARAYYQDAIAFELGIPSEGMRAIDVSDDEQILAAITKDGDIQIWNLDTRSVIKTIKNTQRPFVNLKILPNGKSIAGVTAERGGSDVKIYGINDAIEAKTIYQTDSRNKDISFSNDASILAVSEARNIEIYEIQSGKSLIKIPVEFGRLGVGKFSFDNKYILTSLSENKLGIFDVVSGAKLKEILLPEEPQDIFWSKDSSTIFVSLTLETKAFNFEDGSQKLSLYNAVPIRDGGSVSADGRLLFASDGRSVQIWDLNTQRKIRTLDNYYRETQYKYLDKSGTIVTSSVLGPMSIWSTSTREPSKIETIGSNIAPAFIEPSEKFLFMNTGGEVGKWTIDFGQKISSFSLAGRNGVNFSSDGNKISEIDGKKVKIRDLETSSVLFEFSREDRDYSTSLILPHSDYVALYGRQLSTSAGRGGGGVTFFVDVVNFKTGEIFKSIQQFGPFSGFASNSSGDSLYYLEGNSLINWSYNVSDQGKALTEALYPCLRQFSSPGKMKVFTAGTGLIQLWDLEEGKLEKSVRATSDQANGCLFASKDSSFVAMIRGNLEDQLEIYDFEAGEQLVSFMVSEKILVVIPSSKDLIITGHEGGNLKHWDFRNNGIAVKLCTEVKKIAKGKAKFQDCSLFR